MITPLKFGIQTFIASVLVLTTGAGVHAVTKDQEMFLEYKRLHPNTPITQKYARALEALDYGKQKTAQKLFTELTTEDSKWAGFWTSLGTCHMWTEDFKKGVECATKAIQLRPKDPDMYNRRALLYIALLQYDKAIADLTQGLKLDPKDLDLLKNRAQSYKAQKKYPEALADINTMLQLSPKEETILYVKGEVYEAQKDWKNAIITYSTMLSFYPADDHVLIKRASCRMKTNDFKGAVLDYSEALKHGTEAPEFVYTQRAAAYEKLGMPAKAKRDRVSAQKHIY